MAHPVMFSDDDPGLGELRRICLTFPGAEEKVSHGRPIFRAGAGGKVFAVFGGSEKIRPGEHRMVPSALIFTPDAVDLPALDADERFFVPAYYGPSGGRAIDLAGPDVDWDEVAELVDASYRRVAPKRLLAELEARSAPPGP
ncbi:MmcQ/YjbR family DNA-binding protein [Nocardioides sp. zg-536]|uniref:MmcQ/YjbR family DNA-binding protein n=1 Tax=Nocardioides faecalis TaxID=2803858 RepID=A0A938Y4Q1_9ACTN|nr:MmcQ/YjbR family DNA-binding protein [Nocardioides faecalis]MBM9459215.1 MmcQ/YjbR family DNA-binding protein [Nocardioides faecalis]MBS4751463.1 MmcQ/YjbR family DNA-binding protein [Nocardioides faecalis]QVI59647.1 MmcQ/YjbR family DNA-binding protein [Nocardioides faecalis]